MGKKRDGKLRLASQSTADLLSGVVAQQPARTLYFPQWANKLIASIHAPQDTITFEVYGPKPTTFVAEIKAKVKTEATIGETSIIVGPQQASLTPVQLLQLTRYDGDTAIPVSKESKTTLLATSLWSNDVDTLAGFAVTFGEVTINGKKKPVCDQLPVSLSYPMEGRARLALILQQPDDTELEKKVYQELVGAPKASFTTAQSNSARYIKISEDSLFDTEAYSQLVAHDFIAAISAFHDNTAKGTKLRFGFLSYDPQTFCGPYSKHHDAILSALLEGIKRGLQAYLNAHRKDSKLAELVLPAFKITNAHKALGQEIMGLTGNKCSLKPEELNSTTSLITAIASTVTPAARKQFGNEALPEHQEHVVVNALVSMSAEERNAFSAQVNTKIAVAFDERPKPVISKPATSSSASTAGVSAQQTQKQPKTAEELIDVTSIEKKADQLSTLIDRFMNATDELRNNAVALLINDQSAAHSLRKPSLIGSVHDTRSFIHLLRFLATQYPATRAIICEYLATHAQDKPLSRHGEDDMQRTITTTQTSGNGAGTSTEKTIQLGQLKMHGGVGYFYPAEPGKNPQICFYYNNVKKDKDGMPERALKYADLHDLFLENADGKADYTRNLRIYFETCKAQAGTDKTKVSHYTQELKDFRKGLRENPDNNIRQATGLFFAQAKDGMTRSYIETMLFLEHAIGELGTEQAKSHAGHGAVAHEDIPAEEAASRDTYASSHKYFPKR